MVVFFQIKDKKNRFNQKPKNSLFRTASSNKAYRPASIVSLARKNSSVLAGIKDKQVKIRAKRQVRKAPAPESKPWISSPVTHASPQTPFAGQQMPPRPRPRQKPALLKNPSLLKKPAPSKIISKKAISFSFTLPLLPVLGFIVLGTIFYMDNRDSISYLLYRDVIPSPHADSGGEVGMAAFINNAGLRQMSFSGETANQPDMAGNQDMEAGVFQTTAAAAAAAAEERGTDPIPLAMMEYFEWLDYTVRRGDSVSSIAAAHELSMDAVIASNNMTNAHLLRVGQKIRLPNMNGIPYTVRRGDTISGISQSYNIPLEVIADVNNIQQDLILPGEIVFLPGARMPSRDLRLAMGTYFISPLRGYSARLTSGFGWRADPFHGGQRFHDALDLAITSGTPVRAASAGRIVVIGNNPVYGRFIIMEHVDNYQTLYAHLSSVSVRQGERVEQGVKIGEVGSTGLSTGPHLHFAVFRNGRAVNPLDYMTL